MKQQNILLDPRFRRSLLQFLSTKMKVGTPVFALYIHFYTSHSCNGLNSCNNTDSTALAKISNRPQENTRIKLGDQWHILDHHETTKFSE